jgi:hypothetical protein
MVLILALSVLVGADGSDDLGGSTGRRACIPRDCLESQLASWQQEVAFLAPPAEPAIVRGLPSRKTERSISEGRSQYTGRDVTTVRRGSPAYICIPS